MEPKKREKRRSVFIAIVIAVQAIVTLMFLMFAFYQKAEADTQSQMAEQNAEAARISERDAYEQRAKSEKLIDSLTTELTKLKATTEKK